MLIEQICEDCNHSCKGDNDELLVRQWMLVQLHLQLGGNRGGNAGGNGITCTLVLIRKAGTDNFRFSVLYFPTS